MVQQNRSHEVWYGNGVSLGSGGTLNSSDSPSNDGTGSDMHVPGGDRITGIVDRSNNYSVDIEWLDPDGNVIETEQALGSGSGEREVDEDMHSPYYRIKINDEASSSGSVEFSFQGR